MRLLIISMLLNLLACPTLAQQSNSASSKVNMVASVHPLATEAGVQAFKNGGNAIDAAVATAVTLGVVNGYNSGIGGGCFVLIHRSNGELIAIDGREMAPSAAHRDMYLRGGKADGNLSQLGALAIGVPGALAAYHEAMDRFGKLKLADVLLPAAEICESGFPLTAVYSGRIKAQRRKISQFPATAAVLFNAAGKPHQAGETLKQSDLAITYRSIAQHGLEWFYQGPFAETTDRWMRKNNGIMTSEDFGNYHTQQRKPVRTKYREYEIVGFPPPSSGGVHVAQILNILENFDLKGIHDSDPVQLNHLVAEAMKLAFADRAYWLGDPDFVNVPRQLVSKSYARTLANRIRLDRTISVQSHGVPPLAESDFFEKHTTHLTAADREGNWVAITATVNTTFGSKVIIPGTGVIMNNQMDDFSIAPGVPNAYGLVGSENNSIAPGKRPLSSMSPTIVMKNGRPVFTVGAAGGPKIITQAVWAIINHLDLGLSIGESISRPRIHHQWSPDKLMVEKTLPMNLQDGLKALGHRVSVLEAAGVSQAIGYDETAQMFIGAFDPRIPGQAAGQ